VIALNYLDPSCVDGDGCLGLTRYTIDVTPTHVTLADDPDPAEVGNLALGRARSGEGQWPPLTAVAWVNHQIGTSSS